MRDDCRSLLAAAEQLPKEQLPMLLGEIEVIRCTAMARLTTTEPVASDDRLIPISAAADLLGMSESYLYRNHARFTFARRQGRKLLFSTAEIAAFLRNLPLSSRKEYTSTIAVIQSQRRRRGGNE